VFSGGDKGGMSGADRSREVGGDSRYSGENAVVAYSGGSGGRHGGSGGRQTGGGFIVSEEAFVNALGVIAKSFDVISDVMEFLKEESTSDADVDTRIANIKKMRESVSKRKPAFAGRGSLALPWS
jgi:hypothetical protein